MTSDEALSGRRQHHHEPETPEFRTAAVGSL